MKKLKFISRLLIISNIIIAAFTLLGYCSPVINPAKFWPIAFFGLALPYLLLLNLSFFFYWILRGKLWLFLSLLIIILGYQSIPNYLQLNFSKETVKSDDLKVLSFNVRVFDLYMWSKEKTTRNKILDFLSQEDPDVLCLQEFYHTDIQHPNYEFKTLDTLVKILSAKNYHVHYTANLRGKDHWGLITFSKYPIAKKGLVPFAIKDDNACIYTDIKKGNETIRVYNTHLASIKLNKHDYKAIQEIKKNEYSTNFGKEIELLDKIRFGFERRAGQADSIKQAITSSPHPVIVCGDFNDTPSSYAYRTIKGKLKDAFVESGSGLGRTYIGEFPSFRIDYILFDKNFSAKNYTTFPEKLSDHHPIGVHLEVK